MTSVPANRFGVNSGLIKLGITHAHGGSCLAVRAVQNQSLRKLATVGGLGPKLQGSAKKLVCVRKNEAGQDPFSFTIHKVPGDGAHDKSIDLTAVV